MAPTVCAAAAGGQPAPPPACRPGRAVQLGRDACAPLGRPLTGWLPLYVCAASSAFSLLEKRCREVLKVAHEFGRLCSFGEPACRPACLAAWRRACVASRLPRLAAQCTGAAGSVGWTLRTLAVAAGPWACWCACARTSAALLPLPALQPSTRPTASASGAMVSPNCTPPALPGRNSGGRALGCIHVLPRSRRPQLAHARATAARALKLCVLFIALRPLADFRPAYLQLGELRKEFPGVRASPAWLLCPGLRGRGGAGGTKKLRRHLGAVTAEGWVWRPAADAPRAPLLPASRCR